MGRNTKKDARENSHILHKIYKNCTRKVKVCLVQNNLENKCVTTVFNNVRNRSTILKILKNQYRVKKLFRMN